MRLLVTRPRADADSFAAALAARGVEALIEPMLEIVPLPGPPITRQDHQAILFTSVNGVRALASRNHGQLGDLAPVPVYTVGDATARAARAAGFSRVESASGDVAALASLVVTRLSPDKGALLHVAASRVAGDLAGRLSAAGFTTRRSVLYETHKARALSPATLEGLRRGRIDGVTFFSPRTAAAFVTLARDAGITSCLSATVALCLSDAVAAAASSSAWRAIIVAPRPDQEALLGCLSDMALQPSGLQPSEGGTDGTISAPHAAPAARKTT